MASLWKMSCMLLRRHLLRRMGAQPSSSPKGVARGMSLMLVDVWFGCSKGFRIQRFDLKTKEMLELFNSVMMNCNQRERLGYLSMIPLFSCLFDPDATLSRRYAGSACTTMSTAAWLGHTQKLWLLKQKLVISACIIACNSFLWFLRLRLAWSGAP